MNLDFLTSLDFIFYLMFGFAILMGFLYGMKRTLYNFITMLIFYVVFFLTIDTVVSLLWSMQMPWLAGLFSQVDPALSAFTSFEDSIGLIVNTFVGQQIDLSQMDAQVLVLATGIGMFALKIVYTVLYFTVVLLLYKILCAIIRAIFSSPKRKKESKNRGFGALFGALTGAMDVFVALIMLGGMVSIIDSMTTFMDTASSTIPLSYEVRSSSYETSSTLFNLPTPVNMAEQVDITEQLDLMKELVDNYNANIFVLIANQLMVDVPDTTEQIPLHLSLFDSVLSFDINNQKIALRYELSVYSEAAAVLMNSSFMTTQNVSDITGDQIRNVFGIFSNSKLITALLPIGIEVGTAYLDYPLDISQEDLYAIDYQSELENLGSIAGTLFDIINGAGFISGEGNLDTIPVDGDIVRGLFQDFSDSSLIVLLTSSFLVPLIEADTGTLSLIITVPADLDWSNEFIAVGDILGEVVDSGVSVSDIESGDMNILLNAVSNVDLTVILSSNLITNALINILSGTAQIEALNVLTIPSDLVWRDTVDDFGNITQNGELRNILLALNAITSSLSDFDINNIGLDTIANLDDNVIDSLFESRVLVATVSDMLLTQDIGDLPLVLPDNIFDGNGYLVKTELKALAKAIQLLVSSVDTTNFDIQKILNLSNDDINTLLDSQIISSTIGKMIFDMNTDPLVIPTDAVSQVIVDSANVDVVSSAEIANVINSLQVLGLSNFDNISFDAGIISSLELIPTVGDPTTLDDAKITSLLASKIIHATVSNMIINLGTGTSELLVIPSEDQNLDPVIYTSMGTQYLSETEIGSLLKALYAIGITNFDTIDLEDTSLILEHKTVLLESAIIQATISNQILGISSNFINIPYEDQVGNPIVITTLDATYIDKVELSSFLNALDLLGVTNPTTFTNSFDLSIISSETSQDILLSSSIMQATISQTIFDLGSSVLKVPTTNEDGVTLVKVSTGPVGHITEYIVKSEIKAMINAFTSMGFSNLSSFGSSISSTLLFDHSAEILLSSTLQATLSDQLLGVSSGTLIIPDKDSLGNNIRIVLPDVTYVSKIEIASIIDALKLLGLTDLTTFNLSPTVIFGVDFNQLLASSTMQATVSYYILENANDETALQTEMGLIVPTFFREIILANSVSQTQVEKAELISLLTSLQVLNIGDFSGTMDSTIITTMTDSDLATLLASGSMHTTIDHMLKNNSNINTMIPDLAKETIYGLTDITTKIEIRAFIEATNILAEGDFTTSSFSYTAIAALSESDRNTVLDSMIIRNIITDQLEALMASDDDAPTFDLYLPSNAEYMNSDPLTFLTKVGVNNVLLHYGLIS